jgi:hypothetical protein
MTTFGGFGQQGANDQLNKNKFLNPDHAGFRCSCNATTFNSVGSDESCNRLETK